MGKNRPINTRMWKDQKVVEKFTSEDKLFWFYLLTNDKVNNLGCYKLTKRQVSFDTGFTESTIDNVFTRFMDYHDTIIYDNETNEILIRNYSKYNWTSSPMYRKSLETQFEKIESKTLKSELQRIIDEFYGTEPRKATKIVIERALTNVDGNVKKDELMPFEASKEEEREEDIREIIDYYNEIISKELGTTVFTYKNSQVNKNINARLNDGHEVIDFKKVIDYKMSEWKGTDYQKHLVPNTLFSLKHFSNYLMQSEMNYRKQSPSDKIKDRWGNFLNE